MSRAIAKELDNTKEGDRGACRICSPRSNRVTEDRLWTWAMKMPTGTKPLGHGEDCRCKAR